MNLLVMQPHIVVVLKYLRAQVPPCPWNERFYIYAAMGGYLEILIWARKNGCPWHRLGISKTS